MTRTRGAVLGAHGGRTTTDMSDEDLLVCVRAGDARAFDELWRRHRPALLRFARRLVPSSEAEDVLGDAVTAALGAFSRGAGARDDFRLYMYQAIRTAAIRVYGERGTMSSEELDAEELPSTQDVADCLDGLYAVRAFQSLPEKWQAIVWYLVIEGESTAEVARILGMNPSAVSSSFARAREGLRQAYLTAHAAEQADARCKIVHQKLAGYVRGRISARQRSLVAEHLAECASCRASMAEVEQLERRLPALIVPLLAGTATAWRTVPLAGLGASWGAGGGVGGTLVAKVGGVLPVTVGGKIATAVLTVGLVGAAGTGAVAVFGQGAAAGPVIDASAAPIGRPSSETAADPVAPTGGAPQDVVLSAGPAGAPVAVPQPGEPVPPSSTEESGTAGSRVVAPVPTPSASPTPLATVEQPQVDGPAVVTIPTVEPADQPAVTATPEPAVTASDEPTVVEPPAGPSVLPTPTDGPEAVEPTDEPTPDPAVETLPAITSVPQPTLTEGLVTSEPPATPEPSTDPGTSTDPQPTKEPSEEPPPVEPTDISSPPVEPTDISSPTVLPTQDVEPTQDVVPMSSIAGTVSPLNVEGTAWSLQVTGPVAGEEFALRFWGRDPAVRLTMYAPFAQVWVYGPVMDPRTDWEICHWAVDGTVVGCVAPQLVASNSASSDIPTR